MKKYFLILSLFCFSSYLHSQSLNSGEYNNKGYDLMNQKKFNHAIENFNHAIILDPENALYFQNRANAKLQIKDTIGAISDYESAIKIDSADYENYQVLANIYYIKKEYKNAIKLYSSAIKINPDISDLYFSQANAYVKIDNLEQALAEYNKTIYLESKHEQAIFNRAMVNFKLNRKEEACKDWILSYELGVDDSEFHLEKYCNYKPKKEPIEKIQSLSVSDIEPINEIKNPDNDSIFSYNNFSNNDSINNPYETRIEEKPEFPGGEFEFFMLMIKNIRYPQFAKDNEISGKVIIGCTIDTDGSITNLKVLKSVHPVLDNEALRVVSNSPKWIPGKVNGMPVKVAYKIPLSFTLNGPSDNEESAFIVKNKKILNKGLEYYENKDFVNAIKSFNEVLDLDEYNLNALYNRGLSNYAIANYLEGCDDWRKASIFGDLESKELLKKYCNEKTIIINYHISANELMKTKEFEKAIKYYDIILKTDSTDTIALFNRANANKVIGNLESTCNDWKHLVELGNTSASNNLNQFCSKERLSAYYYKKAEELFKNNDFKNAIEYYNKVILSFPASAPAYLGRAKSYFAIKDKSNACNDAKKAVELGKDEAQVIIDKTCSKK